MCTFLSKVEKYSYNKPKSFQGEIKKETFFSEARSYD